MMYSGFDYLVQSHFRYYEFIGNTLLALAGTYVVNRYFDTLPFLGLGTDLGMAFLLAVLFAASRDALAKYYDRTGRLNGRIAEKEFGTHMYDYSYNGNDHAKEGGSSNKPQPDPKTPKKSATPGKSKSNDKDGAAKK